MGLRRRCKARMAESTALCNQIDGHVAEQSMMDERGCFHAFARRPAGCSLTFVEPTRQRQSQVLYKQVHISPEGQDQNRPM